MKTLSVQLNQQYRSFDPGFSLVLKGDLIILSGVNGSGKSQLIDILSQRERTGSKNKIATEIQLNNTHVTHSDISRRSFKENIEVPELTQASTERIRNSKNQAWEAYRNYRLNFENQQLWDFKESSDIAKKILIDKFGEQKFNDNQINQTEFIMALPSNFVWKNDDIFTNFVGDLFFNYAAKKLHARAKAGDTTEKFNPDEFDEAPWRQLNSLFEELDFEYRFPENYSIVEDGFEINEQPSLFAMDENGKIDKGQTRSLSDLSDGEKAIISLSFASLSGAKQNNKKILLLDEFDANFNPSLTEVFYKILDKYFVSQDILVVIATHSPTTISLAPPYASFYEVFKKRATLSDRILPVQRDDYTELEVANKEFYTRITNQKARIAELENEKKSLEAKTIEFGKLTKPSLFVEGDIDIQYLSKAVEYYPEWKSILDLVNLDQKNGKDYLCKYWNAKTQIKEFLKFPVILLFDCDTNQNNADDNPIYKRRIPFLDTNSIKKGIENLFSDALIIKAESSENKNFTQKNIFNAGQPTSTQEWNVIGDQKKNLANWICSNCDKEDFVNFGSVFELIKTIVESNINI